MTFNIEIEKAIIKFMWKNKRPRIAKAILGRKSDKGNNTIPDLKLYLQSNRNKNGTYWAPKQPGRSIVQNRRHRDKRA